MQSEASYRFNDAVHVLCVCQAAYVDTCVSKNKQKVIILITLTTIKDYTSLYVLQPGFYFRIYRIISGFQVT